MSSSGPNPSNIRIATTMGKAKILMEAMPYIQEFKGKTIVIKYGGSAMADESLRQSFAGDVALLALVGIKPVVVHGGGDRISAAMSQANLETQWVDGLRVTDAATIRVVQTTLAGEVNPDIVRLLGAHGAMAAGMTGIDCSLLIATPRDPQLGYVGEVQQVNPELIYATLADGIVPVIAPLALGNDGHVYNLNADTAAGALASALQATKVVFLTDVDGVYRDFSDRDSLVLRASPAELREMIQSGSVAAGMLPKLEACIAAVEAGVARAHILDGRVQHALLLEMFTPEGIGTMVRDVSP